MSRRDEGESGGAGTTEEGGSVERGNRDDVKINTETGVRGW